MKCLRVRCGKNILLLDLDYVVEVLEKNETTYVSRGKALWREQKVAYVDLVNLFADDTGELQTSSTRKYVVVAPARDIEADNFRQAQLLAVDDLHDLIDADSERANENIVFNNQALNSLVSNTLYDESLDVIQLYLNLPLDISSLSYSEEVIADEYSNQ